MYIGINYYNDKVEGLCGNYNGKSNDDIGSEEMANSVSEQVVAWKTIPSCPEPEAQTTSDPCKVCQRDISRCYLQFVTYSS